MVFMNKSLLAIIGNIVLSILWIENIAAGPEPAYLSLYDSEGAALQQATVQVPFIVEIVVQEAHNANSLQFNKKGNVTINPLGTIQNTTIRNGITSKRTQYRFEITPQEQEEITIGPIMLEIQGKPYQIDERVIPVGLTSTRKASEQDIIFEYSNCPTTLFVGQKGSITLQALVPAGRTIALEQLILPTVDTIHKEAISERTVHTTINNSEYVGKEWTIPFFAQQAERLVIPPAQLFYSDRQQRRDFFAQFFQSAGLSQKKMMSNACVIQIKPLPEPVKGQIVGILTAVHLEAHESTFAVGKGTTVTLTLEGQANWHDMSAPSLAIPEGLKVYSASVRDYEHGKKFEYVIQALNPGTYTIDPCKVTYFNPQDERYYSLQSEALTFQVHDAQTSPSNQKEVSAAKMEEQENKQEIGFELAPGNWRIARTNNRGWVVVYVWYGLLALWMLIYGGRSVMNALRFWGHSVAYRYWAPYYTRRAMAKAQQAGNAVTVYYIIKRYIASILHCSPDAVNTSSLESLLSPERYNEWKIWYEHVEYYAFGTQQKMPSELFNQAYSWITILWTLKN